MKSTADHHEFIVQHFNQLDVEGEYVVGIDWVALDADGKLVRAKVKLGNGPWFIFEPLGAS